MHDGRVEPPRDLQIRNTAQWFNLMVKFPQFADKDLFGKLTESEIDQLETFYSMAESKKKK
jgi:hypothetical protein